MNPDLDIIFANYNDILNQNSQLMRGRTFSGFLRFSLRL